MKLFTVYILLAGLPATRAWVVKCVTFAVGAGTLNRHIRCIVHIVVSAVTGICAAATGTARCIIAIRRAHCVAGVAIYAA